MHAATAIDRLWLRARPERGVLDHRRRRADTQKPQEGPERRALRGTCVTPVD